MSLRTSSFGAGNSILRSIRPGLSRAESRMSILLVAIITCRQIIVIGQHKLIHINIMMTLTTAMMTQVTSGTITGIEY